MNRLFSAIVVKMRIDSHYSTTKNDKTAKIYHYWATAPDRRSSECECGFKNMGWQ